MDVGGLAIALRISVRASDRAKLINTTDMNEEKTTQAPDDCPSDASTCYALDRRPWWKRAINRLFKWHDGTPDLPEWAKDGLMVETNVEWSFVDRIRILLTGNTSIRTWTACENPPGRVVSLSSAVARPPKWSA